MSSLARNKYISYNFKKSLRSRCCCCILDNFNPGTVGRRLFASYCIVAYTLSKIVLSDLKDREDDPIRDRPSKDRSKSSLCSFNQTTNLWKLTSPYRAQHITYNTFSADNQAVLSFHNRVTNFSFFSKSPPVWLFPFKKIWWLEIMSLMAHISVGFRRARTF